MHPAVEVIQKKTNKTQYLYQQLCNIEKELSLLGPSAFHSPHSYSQASQQVQGMKGFLEEQIFKSSCVNQDENTQKKYRNHLLQRPHRCICPLTRNCVYLFLSSRLFLTLKGHMIDTRFCFCLFFIFVITIFIAVISGSSYTSVFYINRIMLLCHFEALFIVIKPLKLFCSN